MVFPDGMQPGLYLINFRYQTIVGDKNFKFWINDDLWGEETLKDQGSKWENMTIEAEIDKTAVNNNNGWFKIQGDWGWFVIDCVYFDKMESPTSFVVEAETGSISGGGLSVKTDKPGYTGKGYVGDFEQGDKDWLTLVFPTGMKPAQYEVNFRYQTITGDKNFHFWINDDLYGELTLLDRGSKWTNMTISVYIDKPAVNNGWFKIQGGWGWFDIDCVYFEEKKKVPKDYSKTAKSLVNSNATKETVDLYNYLRSIYGKKTLAGNTFINYDDLVKAVGLHPAVLAFDFAPYSPEYPYDWKDGHFAFGPRPDLGHVNESVSLYAESNKKLIVSFHWHWGSPGGARDSKAGTNTFYTEFTSFDVRNAVKPGTQENGEILRDIDAIAVYLKKLQDNGIPVLWRPLHEASGGWFWWGAHGGDAFVKLWNIMYDRLTNYHNLNNLIWILNSQSYDSEWFVGFDKFDMFTMDSYPNPYDYSPQGPKFDDMYKFLDGKKIIAMSENGAIPDIDKCYDSKVDAKWLYFLTWCEYYKTDNTIQHVKDVYSSDNVITLEKRI